MKQCGLLGEKLGHSYSPQIHALLGTYAYDLFEKKPDELVDFIRSGDWSGLNVTIPYKKTAAALCDELSPLAKELGSVNTLVRRADGTVYGDNTDAWGFEQMLRKTAVDCAGKKALVLGSGGASVTIQAVLRRLGADVVVISRSGANNYTNLECHADARLLVNTTPVGMYPNNGESPVDLGRLPALEAVLDIVYNPARTRLILDAQLRGIPCESGLFMLVGQAVRAAELFTGTVIPPEKMETVWKQIDAEMKNIVLIGMPGCGKSSAGQLLAERTGRTLVDSDTEIERRIGMPIPQYFSEFGEAAFRSVETQVLAELGKGSGQIIATGGGCVTRAENYELLHQNGTIVWLQRDPAKLPVDGRPLSQQEGVAALYQKRLPLYRQFADAAVDNHGTLDETVAQILEVL